LKAPDNAPEVMAFNLEDALAGKEQDLVLQPFDTVRVFGRFDFEEPPLITVTGEVRDPGDHVTNGATYLRDAVYLAGNTTADAQLDDVQVFRKAEDGKLQVLSVNLSKALQGDPNSNILLLPKDRVFIHKDLAKALAGEPDSDVRLHDGDVLTIRQLAGWSDMGATITVKGEVLHPGTYGIQEGERLSSIIQRAGGFRANAYPYGAVFERTQVRELEEKNRSDLIQRVQSEAAQVRIIPGMDVEHQMTAQAAVLQ